MGSIAAPRKGNSTSDNNRFLRYWAEVDRNKMNIGSEEIVVADSIKRRWYPYNKGGGYRNGMVLMNILLIGIMMLLKYVLLKQR